MAPPSRQLWPLQTKVLVAEEDTGTDALPATYQYYNAAGKHIVANPAEDIPAFLHQEFSLGHLANLLNYLWLAGVQRPAMPLHFHLALGRTITLADRTDLHLLWTSSRQLFVKPIPRFLLDPAFCQRHLQCPPRCPCPDHPSCRLAPRRVALGLLHTYACLVASETDFHLATALHLLPPQPDGAPVSWAAWKALARELLHIDPTTIHPRFLRGELRLSRLNTIRRFTRLPPLRPYLRSSYDYSSLFRDNLAWMATAAVFAALVLTAMQVGLATERLQGDAAFQRAAHGFAVFSMLGPTCVFGLLIAYALFNLANNVWSLLRGRRGRDAVPDGAGSGVELKTMA